MRVPTIIVYVFVVLLAGVKSAFAQPGPDGYDFVTIGAVNNPAYSGPDPFDRVTGRGSVGYEYKIGRTEVTTAQWMEYLNAGLARPDPLPITGMLMQPVFWGAEVDPTYTGPGTKYRLRSGDPNAAMRAVGGISWRQAAGLCNWLHNGKSTAASAFMNGAYDVSTFSGGFPTFGDQAAHHPDAKYWIPTMDEWIKAAHFDPNGNGGQGRWWEQVNGTDTPLIYGPPPSFGGDGTGQANAGFNLPGFGEKLIPLGAYPNVQSPWGLLDVAGGTQEWLEDIRVVDGQMYRRFDGSAWGGSSASGPDLVWGMGADSPGAFTTLGGFRIVSAVPAPSSVLVFMCLGGMYIRRCRRK